jgi:hypothetical protein
MVVSQLVTTSGVHPLYVSRIRFRFDAVAIVYVYIQCDRRGFVHAAARSPVASLADVDDS